MCDCNNKVFLPAGVVSQPIWKLVSVLSFFFNEKCAIKRLPVRTSVIKMSFFTVDEELSEAV